MVNLRPRSPHLHMARRPFVWGPVVAVDCTVLERLHCFLSRFLEPPTLRAPKLSQEAAWRRMGVSGAGRTFVYRGFVIPKKGEARENGVHRRFRENAVKQRAKPAGSRRATVPAFRRLHARALRHRAEKATKVTRSQREAPELDFPSDPPPLPPHTSSECSLTGSPQCCRAEDTGFGYSMDQLPLHLMFKVTGLSSSGRIN